MFKVTTASQSSLR